jgi:hypothetical protein
MNLSKNQLEEIEKLAALQFSPREVAIILQVDEEDFSDHVEIHGDVRLRYQRGRLKASAEVRMAILTQAKNGSSPAQKQMLDLIASAQGQVTEPIVPKKMSTKKFKI